MNLSDPSLLRVLLSPFAADEGMSADIVRDMFSDSFEIRLRWSVTADALRLACGGSGMYEALWAPFEAASVAMDRGDIEAGKTCVTLGED